MGLTYTAPNNGGDVNVGWEFSNVATQIFDAEANDYYFGPNKSQVNATLFYPNNEFIYLSTFYVGHSLVTENGFAFDIEGTIEGSLDEEPVGRYLVFSTSGGVFSMDHLFGEADNLTGNASNNVLNGLGGADVLDGSFGDDVLFGGNDGDRLAGGYGADVLLGEAGDDTLSGGQGGDLLDGGDGRDLVDYSLNTAGVVVTVGGGNAKGGGDAFGDRLVSVETVIGSQFNDRLTGDATSTRLFGGLGNDQLHGGAGDDILDGGIGKDLLDGGAGRDTASYAASSGRGVQVDLTSGKVSGGDAAGDTLKSIENVDGSGFDDRITGSNVANRLFGDLGNDTLSGGDGDDLLIGGGNDDKLIGGAGKDVFQFSSSLGDHQSGTDTILDWEDGVDKIGYFRSVVDEFSDLTISDGVDGSGHAVAVIDSADGTIWVRGATAAQFSVADFSFPTIVPEAPHHSWQVSRGEMPEPGCWVV